MQAGKSQRSVLALVITCALILGFGIPLIPLVGVDSAEGTEVSAASDVATVSAENSLQNGSFEQPDVYQYRETSDVPYWKSTTTSGNIEIGSVFKNGNGDNDSLHMRTVEKVAAAEGSQFGKPATSNGNYSIYQRLATTQGAKYRWSLKHRARPSGSKSGFDTLAVITADTHGAEPPSFSWGGGTQPIGNTGTVNQYEIKMKRSDGITMEQKVKDADAADYTATTTAGVGDTVDFYVKLTIPAYKANAYASIVVNDTLTDLSIDPSSVKVHKDSASGDVIDGAVSYDATTGKFTLAAGKVSAADTDMTVYLTYSATVAKGADTDTVHSATNSVTVAYNTETTATENGFTTASSSTTIYNYSLKVSKKSDSGKDLDGAVFTFYSKQAAEGTDVIKFVKDGDADYYRPAQAVETAAVSELTAPFAIRGLDETTIYAKETTTPKGYTVPSGVFKATLVGAKESNNYTGLLDNIKSTIEAIAPADAGLVQSKTVNETKDWQYDVTIQDTRTSALPTTGSVGTVLFAVLGIALMAGAVWLYARSKRQSAK